MYKRQGRSDTDTAEVYGLLQSGLQQAGKGAGEYQPADGGIVNVVSEWQPPELLGNGQDGPSA